jgi:hypothetical protein
MNLNHLEMALSAEPSDLKFLSDACSHIQNVTHEVAIRKLGDAAMQGHPDAIFLLEEHIELCSERKQRYHLDAALKTLGFISKSSEIASSLLLRLVKHNNSDVRAGALTALRTQLRSSQIITALSTLQQSGKITEFESYQALIREAHDRLECDSNHLVRLAALGTLSELVQNLHYDSIVCVTKSLSDEDETIRKLAAEMLCEALMSSRETKKRSIGNVYIEEGFFKLLDAGIFVALFRQLIIF